MIFDKTNFNEIIFLWIGLACIIFIVLNFIKAPYGKHDQKGWGIRIPSRIAWIGMEMPSWLLMGLFALLSIQSEIKIITYIIYKPHTVFGGISILSIFNLITVFFI